MGSKTVAACKCTQCGAVIEDPKSPCPGCGRPPAEDLAKLNQVLRETVGERYEITSRLGGGTYGAVYKARDTILDRNVAIKRLRLDAFSDPGNLEEVKQRFLREARVVAKLNHPNIVTIHDIVDAPTVSFIVMEFVNGPTLETLLKDKTRLTLEETISIVSQTAEAIDHAHRNNVVHRDVTPANIMIESSGRVKVSDFGIAKADASTNLTCTGAILGTPNYMSPEQARGQAGIDGRSDIFSLGCIVYECLSGDKPFHAESPIATLMRVLNEDAPTIDHEALGLHPAIAKILRRALAKDPAERFDSGGELVRALRSAPVLERPPQAQAPTLPVERAPDAESPASPQRRPPVTDPAAPQPAVTRRDPRRAPTYDAELQGDLGEKGLAEVIRKVYANRKTGILHLKREGVGKRIYFRKGSIVFANSDLNDDRLGEFMIRQGDIDRTVFDLASQLMKATGQRLGRTLVELGHMSEEKMKVMVRAQIQAIIYTLFVWESGSYRFEPLDNPVEEDIVVQLSTADTILEGIRRMNSAEAVRRCLGDLGQVLCHSENPLLLYQKISLTPEEGFLLSRIDGMTSISETASISPLGEEQTLRSIYGLVSSGVLELKERPTARTTRRRHLEAQQVEVPKPEADIRSSAPATEPEPDPAEPGKAPTGPAPEQQAIREEIAAKHASLATANHYELLEILPTASSADIKKAFYGMVKRYHPDRHHSPHLRDLHGLLEELVAKMTAAYELLSDPSQRKRYDDTLRAGTAPDPSQRFEPIDPDFLVGSSNGPPSPEALAESHYLQGKRRFNDMAYFDAIQCLQEAVRLDPKKAPYHKLLGKALAKNPNWRKEAEQHFLKGLDIDPEDVECHLGLAEIYDALNLATRSRNTYRKILELDPDNEAAQMRVYGKKLSAGGLKSLKNILKRAR